jgi:hypothetical protein
MSCSAVRWTALREEADVAELIGAVLLALQAFSGIVGGPRVCVHDGKLAFRGSGPEPVEIGVNVPGAEVVVIGKDCQR